MSSVPAKTFGGFVRCTVTSVNFSRVPSAVVLGACTAAFAVTIAACGSDTAGPSASKSSTAPVASTVTQAAGPDATCPSAPPASAGTPEWTLPGATGSVAVTGSTDTAAPVITVTPPFSVNATQVQTLQAGNGPVVAPTATVSVCYEGVNGRDGNVFDSSYQRGEPAEFSLDGVVPGFQKAIAGQKVGSTVAVAMVSADGYPQGQPRAGILPGDTLIFAIKILSAS